MNAAARRGILPWRSSPAETAVLDERSLGEGPGAGHAPPGGADTHRRAGRPPPGGAGGRPANGAQAPAGAIGTRTSVEIQRSTISAPVSVGWNEMVSWSTSSPSMAVARAEAVTTSFSGR